jgi:putative endonuclease
MSKPSVDANSQKKSVKIMARVLAQRRGQWAEFLARAYLRVTGRRILAKNFKTPVGEIDIIAREGGLVCFIEVKARTTKSAAAEAISATQKRRIQRAAELFLNRNPNLRACDVRFDVALVSGPLSITYLRDAWRP